MMGARDVVVIGGCWEGRSALGPLLRAVPDGARVAIALSAPGAGASSLVAALAAAPGRRVTAAEEGAALAAGGIVAAETGAHLLVEQERVRLGRGPRENGLRPAADALFRSAALAWGPRVLAILLPPAGADGPSGLDAVRRCGGGVLHWRDDGDAAKLPKLLSGEGEGGGTAPPAFLELLHWEVTVARGEPVDRGALARFGAEAGRPCPACALPLFNLAHDSRFRCERGHAFAPELLGITKAEAERQRRALGAEFQHRARNMLALIRSVAARTADNSASVEDLAMHLEGRLDAIARVQVLSGREVGAGTNLEYLVAEELVAHLAHEGSRLAIAGPQVHLSFRAAQALALAIHELATNALKFGALSRPEGKLGVTWRIEHDGSAEPGLVLDWTETGAPSPMPGEGGFGMELLRRMLRYELRAEVAIEWRVDGLACRLTLPFAKNVVAAAA